MALIKKFLIWLEERQVGILSTISIHLFIALLIVLIKLRTEIVRPYSITLDVSFLEQYDDLEKSMEGENGGESYADMNFQANNVRNIAANAADRIQQMIDDIKTEENITDPLPQNLSYTSTSDDNLDDTYNSRYPTDSSGERTIFRGETTVSYELTGRRHISMQPPVYRCSAGGTIVVNIVVNANGYVLNAEVNRSRSNSEDQCLVDNAKRYAERARFNQSSQNRQQGTITYVFQAQ